MRPNHRWTVLHVFILAGMLLTLKADGEESDCEVEVKVDRNTVYEAVLGEDLRINCTVEFCSGSPPTVSWYKRETTNVPVNVSSSSHIKTEWKLLKQLEGRSFLIFQKVRRNDSGAYQCQGGGSLSHYINVSVHGDGGGTNVTKNNGTRITLEQEPSEDLWLYMYFAAGIVAFVIIVIIISVVSMRGCKGKSKSKKETQTDNQYIAIPMVEQPFLHNSPQPLPRGIPFAPPCRRSTRRKTPPSQPNEPPLPKDNEHVYGKTRGDRERRGVAVQEAGGSLVYAALNHQLPAAAAARPRRPREETSEYAAIRVKDPSPTRLKSMTS
ncbi:B- and T-lymphocyte attenuator-like isoform X2 [Anarhichas minor]|uniref:B- and T-lymphocyte attenuator-like isoform X2 n=1 Tax=Anarhichas minor TaxID=65739 RepID=UPI003F73F2C6